MKTTTTAAATVSALILPAIAAAAPSPWKIDESHTSAQFSVRHMMVSNVRGEFRKVSGTVELDEQDLTKSKIDVAIDAASIDSRDAKRDAHLKAEDFFHAAKYPAITFRSKKVARAKDGQGLLVTGDLSIRGVTREVQLAVDGLGESIRDPYGFYRRGAHATTTINRRDFGMVWNAALDKGGVAVGESVTINIDVELMRPADTAKKS